MSYVIIMEIGDWSDDGHGKCKSFIFNTNKPVEEIREIHFKMESVFGFTIQSFANEYENKTVSEEYLEVLWQIMTLDQRNMIFSVWEEVWSIKSPSGMALLWSLMLMHVDPSLIIKADDPINYPTLSFYGIDEQGRHIGFIGYGLFS